MRTAEWEASSPALGPDTRWDTFGVGAKADAVHTDLSSTEADARRHGEHNGVVFHLLGQFEHLPRGSAACRGAFDRGDPHRGEQDVPDRLLQLRMLEDALDFNGDPGIAVLLSGDGAGCLEGAGFHRTLERMHSRGWRIEILSWAHSCNQRMRRWADEHGVFVALDGSGTDMDGASQRGIGGCSG